MGRRADASTMKAAVCHRYGPPSVVKVARVPRPAPREDELLVRVHATTVSSGDARLRAADVPRGLGLLVRLGFGVTGPRKRVLGVEFAGVVETTGGAVRRFAPGDRVFGIRGAGMGCHAEFVPIREGGAVATLPKGFTFGEAAALPFAGTSALHFLRDLGGVRAGERVLVNGASGAVGSAAVQLANHLGAKVTGVCSAANANLVRSLGAERVLDYTREDFAREREAWDVILDTVGNGTFARCRDALAPGGRLLLLVATLGQMVGAALRPTRAGRRVLAGVAPERAEDVRLLARLAERGALRPVVDSTVPLERIADAHARVDSHRKRGSVVVTVA